ncbi:uncharacterized protein [Scyliorhinus torazame]|uniref:uncharacterized protein n=1 Tax=Scyliorhinus torazame TaxID=75743 RepID=UPI003B5B830B
MLDIISREGKIKFHLSEEAYSLMLDLARTIMEVGDYEIQVAISEALCRMTDRKTREGLICKWFDEPHANAFKEIKDSEFETDCRTFLNALNESLCNKRRVYTYPCNSAFLDLNELKIPADDKLEKFWIDFNLGSRSITFFIKDDSQDSEVDLWETVSLVQDGVKSFSVQAVFDQASHLLYKVILSLGDGNLEKDKLRNIPVAFFSPKEEISNKVNTTAILIINLKGLLSVSKKKGKKVKIYFDCAFDILTTTKLVYGDDKLLASFQDFHMVLNELHGVNLPSPPMESELKTTGLVSNEVTVLGSQHPNSDRSETKHPASDGELDRRLDSTQSEEQRYYSDTERHHRKSVKVTSKLKNTTALGSSKSRFQRFSAIYISKDALPVQKESVQNNEGAQSLDPEEVQRFDDISIRIPSHLPSTKKIHPPEMTEPKQNVNAEDTGMETSKNRFSVTVESERITSKSVERDVFDFRSSSDSAGKFQVRE